MILLTHFAILMSAWIWYLPAYTIVVVPALYIGIMGSGAFWGGKHIDVHHLAAALGERWKHPYDLATYMKRYWVALKYSGAASARQNTCGLLAVLQILAGVIVLWKSSVVIGTVAVAEGILLWLMATRVNRPLSMYKDSRVRNSDDALLRNEWLNGVASLIAYAELNPNSGNAKFIATHLLNDEQVVREISTLRKDDALLAI